jgi:hypothetical protein
MVSKKLDTDKAAQISATEFKPLRDALVAWYSATDPRFQPEQVMNGALGVQFPSKQWKEW